MWLAREEWTGEVMDGWMGGWQTGGQEWVDRQGWGLLRHLLPHVLSHSPHHGPASSPSSSSMSLFSVLTAPPAWASGLTWTPAVTC